MAKKIIQVTNETKSERTQILLRPSTKEALKRVAEIETDGSLNELINRICEDYLLKLVADFFEECERWLK